MAESKKSRAGMSAVSEELEETLKAILDGLKSILDYDAAAIYLVAPESGQLRSQIVRGSPTKSSDSSPFRKAKV